MKTNQTDFSLQHPRRPRRAPDPNTPALPRHRQEPQLLAGGGVALVGSAARHNRHPQERHAFPDRGEHPAGNADGGGDGDDEQRASHGGQGSPLGWDHGPAVQYSRERRHAARVDEPGVWV